MEREWLIPCRVEFDGEAIVTADSAAQAALKFNSGDFEFQNATASVLNWEIRGGPKENS